MSCKCLLVIVHVLYRYTPNVRLAYEYPDESYEGLGPILPLGIDGAPIAHEEPTASHSFADAATSMNIINR